MKHSAARITREGGGKCGKKKMFAPYLLECTRVLDRILEDEYVRIVVPSTSNMTIVYRDLSVVLCVCEQTQIHTYSSTTCVLLVVEIRTVTT